MIQEIKNGSSWLSWIEHGRVIHYRIHWLLTVETKVNIDSPSPQGYWLSIASLTDPFQLLVEPLIINCWRTQVKFRTKYWNTIYKISATLTWLIPEGRKEGKKEWKRERTANLLTELLNTIPPASHSLQVSSFQNCTRCERNQESLNPRNSCVTLWLVPSHAFRQNLFYDRILAWIVMGGGGVEGGGG